MLVILAEHVPTRFIALLRVMEGKLSTLKPAKYYTRVTNDTAMRE